MRFLHPRAARDEVETLRVPGFPISICAGSCNKAKSILWVFVLVSGLALFGLWIKLSVCSHTPTVQLKTISWFPNNIFLMRPLIFWQHTIHQVIWPSPGTLETLVSLLEDWVRTPMTVFGLICTIISNKTCILDQYQKTNFELAGVDRRRASRYDWTGSTSALYQKAFVQTSTAKEWTNCTLNSNERTSVHFWVIASWYFLIYWDYWVHIC